MASITSFTTITVRPIFNDQSPSVMELKDWRRTPLPQEFN
jgi:hypothetical protein